MARTRRVRIVRDREVGGPEEFTLDPEELAEQQATNQDQEFYEGVQEGVSEQAPGKTRRPTVAETRAAKAEEHKLAVHKTLAEECSIIIGVSFAGAAWLTKHEHWGIDARDSDELGKAVAAAIPSMPLKQAEAVVKRLPMLRLAITAGIMVGGRLYTEIEIRKMEHAQRLAQQQNPFRNAPTTERNVTPPQPPQPTQPQDGFEIPGRDTTGSSAAGGNGTVAPGNFDIPGINSN